MSTASMQYAPFSRIPIDLHHCSVDNSFMTTELHQTTDPLEAADNQAVMEHVVSKRPIDPDVVRRVHERAEKVKAKIRKRGITNIAVELIREARDQ